MTDEPRSFHRDIRPLFRDADVDAMSFVIDLSSYEDVRANADVIYDRLRDGSMPCDSGWSPARVDMFRRWVEGGMSV